MPEEKDYHASTGVNEFFYGEVGEDIVASYIEHVKFLQNITVDMPQEITKAYGDNKVAELAVSAGDVTVKSAFHKIPMEDKQRLLGLEVVDGITGMGSEDNPPYVAVVFAKTHENGMCEYVGLPKGIFTRPNIEGKTKEDKPTFSSEEIEAQFMDRKISGFKKDKSVLFAVDQKGSTTNRDALFMKVFGKPYPTTTAEPAGA